MLSENPVLTSDESLSFSLVRGTVGIIFLPSRGEDPAMQFVIRAIPEAIKVKAIRVNDANPIMSARS